MSSTRPSNPHNIEFARIAETEEDLAFLRRHVKDIVEGAAFKGSYRNGQFLQYIIDQGIAGHFDSLKERMIGVELFGRSPTYDTGEDAAVRVTASDIRKTPSATLWPLRRRVSIPHQSSARLLYPGDHT
jgi:hypothetical protein